VVLIVIYTCVTIIATIISELISFVTGRDLD